MALRSKTWIAFVDKRLDHLRLLKRYSDLKRQTVMSNSGTATWGLGGGGCHQPAETATQIKKQQKKNNAWWHKHPDKSQQSVGGQRLRRQKSVQIKVFLINKKVTKSESPGKFTSQNTKIKPNYCVEAPTTSTHNVQLAFYRLPFTDPTLIGTKLLQGMR